MRGWLVVGMSAVMGCAHAPPSRPDEARYPNLRRAWDAIELAKADLERAEAAHRDHGTLGGHGVQAVQSIVAAEHELDAAARFAAAHHTSGPGAAPTPRPAIASAGDDARYPNLGTARVQVTWAIRHVEDAMESNASTGGLGGHGERAVEHLRATNAEIVEAERWADAHQ